MKFNASYDKSTKIITALVTVLILIIVVFTWISLRAAGTIIPVVLVTFVISLSFVMPYGFSVTHYTIDSETLSICRPFGKKQFPLAALTNAVIIDPKLLRWSWRVFGSGGMFGYYGRFSNKHFGMMTWYLTRRDKILYLQLVNGKKIMISPDDPVRFLQEYNLLKGMQQA